MAACGGTVPEVLREKIAEKDDSDDSEEEEQEEEVSPKQAKEKKEKTKIDGSCISLLVFCTLNVSRSCRLFYYLYLVSTTTCTTCTLNASHSCRFYYLYRNR